MENGVLLVRVKLDYRMHVVDSTPAADIHLYTGFVDDEVVWGGAKYRANFGDGIRPLEGILFPINKSPEDCWKQVRADWRDETGWLQHKTVVCRGQGATANSEIKPHNLLVLQHLARAQALLAANGYADFGIYATLARRLSGLIRVLNREWSAAVGIPA
jgi:hypothetical protein